MLSFLIKAWWPCVISEFVLFLLLLCLSPLSTYNECLWSKHRNVEYHFLSPNSFFIYRWSNHFIYLRHTNYNFLVQLHSAALFLYLGWKQQMPCVFSLLLSKECLFPIFLGHQFSFQHAIVARERWSQCGARSEQLTVESSSCDMKAQFASLIFTALPISGWESN